MTFHLHCLVFTFLVFHFLITAFTPTMFFVFIRVLHSLKTLMAPAEFCICPWLALPEKCVDSCSVLYLSVAYTPKTICWFMKCFVYISMACSLQILCWFLQCFVIRSGVYPLKIVLIPTVFCIYPWPAFSKHCADSYCILYLFMACILPTLCQFLQHFAFIHDLHSPNSMLIPTAFCIYPLPAAYADSYSVLYLSVACTRREVVPGSRAECPASGTMKNSASGHLWKGNENDPARSSRAYFSTTRYSSALTQTACLHPINPPSHKKGSKQTKLWRTTVQVFL